jgi:hypothetical protein
MRKSFLFPALAVVALASVMQGCRKENGIDNETVVLKPYALFFTNSEGDLQKTNNGTDLKTIFPNDGYSSRALTTSFNSLIWVKANLHLSANNGTNFNPTYQKVSPWPQWQSMILDVPDHKRVYISSTEPGGWGRGIAYSEDTGRTWIADTLWNRDNPNKPGGIHSFAQLKNGNVFAMDKDTRRLYKRTSKDNRWTQVIAASPLPGSVSNFYLARYANVLLAVDYLGAAGIWYSNDEGANWAPYTGLPTTRRILSVHAPFDQYLLVGTDSTGLYRLSANGTSFIPSSTGLETYASIRGITSKSDLYKNGVEKRYIYATTNKGLFRSEDFGQNWVMMIPGNFVSIY